MNAIIIIIIIVVVVVVVIIIIIIMFLEEGYHSVTSIPSREVLLCVVCSKHRGLGLCPLFQAQRYWSGSDLVGLVVKASASRAEGPGFKSRLRRDFSEVQLYQ